MKKLDIKKLILFLILIVALVVGLVFVFKDKKGEEKKATTEEAKLVETKTINYLVELTAGNQSKYNGIDVLYSKDKTTKNNLTNANIIATSIAYLTKNNKATTDSALNAQIAREQKLDISNYSVYKGEEIKEAAKELFGIDFKHSSIMNAEDHIYTYWYLEEYDVYLVGFSPNYQDATDYSYRIIPKVVETTKDKDKNLKTEVAISYVYFAKDNSLKFSKDPNMGNIVYESNEQKYEIADDKVNEFDHYIFTFKNVDGNYVFESVEKK